MILKTINCMEMGLRAIKLSYVVRIISLGPSPGPLLGNMLPGAAK